LKSVLAAFRILFMVATDLVCIADSFWRIVSVCLQKNRLTGIFL
jgi:hypothetical protein